QGTAAFTEHWKDAVGDLATSELADLANSYQVAGGTIRGVAMTLEGLGESAELSQKSLHSAVDYAQQHGMTVDERTGQASYPQFGPYSAEQVHARGLANLLIAEA